MIIHVFVGFICSKKNQMLNKFLKNLHYGRNSISRKKIQVFRSDNGKEYFDKILGTYFLEKGIIHQSSCFDTPQQNGVAERKKINISWK